ncbi:hypothetical protein EV1_021118 [Malus domestica]
MRENGCEIASRFLLKLLLIVQIILEVLINGGASQQACEEALLEASYLGRARSSEMLMGSDMICPQAVVHGQGLSVVHALASTSCRGFVD